MQMSLIDLWSSMGWFARSIVFILLIMSMLSLGNADMSVWKERLKRERDLAERMKGAA